MSNNIKEELQFSQLTAYLHKPGSEKFCQTIENLDDQGTCDLMKNLEIHISKHVPSQATGEKWHLVNFTVTVMQKVSISVLVNREL